MGLVARNLAEGHAEGEENFFLFVGRFPGRLVQAFPDRHVHLFENFRHALEEQLEWLRNAGFRNVDTYYKNLMFAVYGGNRPDF